jgi:hypothetical protein
MIGRILSEKGKISQAKLGNSYGKNQSTSMKIEVTDLELNIKTTYDSIGDAAKALNARQSSISNYFNRGQIKPFKEGIHFKKHSRQCLSETRGK